MCTVFMVSQLSYTWTVSILAVIKFKKMHSSATENGLQRFECVNEWNFFFLAVNNKLSIFVSLKTIKTVFNVNYRTEMRENQLCLVHELWITTVLPVFYVAYAFVWVLVHLLTIKPYSLDSVISNNVVGEFKWRLNLTDSLHYFHFTNAISSLFF